MRVLFVSNFLLCCIANTFAQSPREAKAEFFPAVKFGEFSDLAREDWEKELKRFAEHGANFRKSRLHIIVYAQTGTDRNSINLPRKQFEEYLERIVGDSTRIYSAPGGYRKQQTSELWILSVHDTLPKPTPDEKFMPEKHAEAHHDNDVKPVMESFFLKLQNERDAQGYIINYGTDEEIARREMIIRENLSFRCFDVPRITLVRGGENGRHRTVFWIVPWGADNPEP